MNLEKKPAVVAGAMAIVLICGLALIVHFHRQRTHAERSVSGAKSAVRTVSVQVERGEAAHATAAPSS